MSGSRVALAALLARLAASEPFAALTATLTSQRGAALIHLPHPAKAALVAALAAYHAPPPPRGLAGGLRDAA